MVVDHELLKSASSGTRRVGQLPLVRYLKGNRISPRQAIMAKCYDCNGMGDQDQCDIVGCALYPYSQWNKNRLKGPGKGNVSNLKRKSLAAQ